MKQYLIALLSKTWMKPIRAAGVLTAGKSVHAVLSLIYLALTARTLGVEAFGVLMLIHSMILTAAKLARFQTWQAVVHFAAKTLEASSKPDTQRVFRFTVFLDLSSAVTAYILIYFTADYASKLFGISEEYVGIVQLYGLVVLLFYNHGTPYGVLQLFDRFDLISKQTVVPSLVRLIGAVFLWYGSAGLIEFLILWFAAELIASITLMSFAISELRRQGLIHELTKFKRKEWRPMAGGWRYVWGTHFASTLDLSNTQLPVLITGAVLGPVGAGLFRIAKQFASILTKPSSQLFARAIYPDLAKFSAQQDRGKASHMLRRTAVIVGAMGSVVFLIILIAGEWLLGISAGEEFIPAYPALLWLSLAGLLGTFGFALDPMLVASGAVRQAVIARLSSTLVYLPLLYWLLQQIGIAATGIAALIGIAVSLSLMLIFVVRLLNSNSQVTEGPH